MSELFLAINYSISESFCSDYSNRYCAFKSAKSCSSKAYNTSFYIWFFIFSSRDSSSDSGFADRYEWNNQNLRQIIQFCQSILVPNLYLEMLIFRYLTTNLWVVVVW